MSAIELDAVFTRAGINSLLRKRDVGIRQAIKYIALGDTAFLPTENMTTLIGEKERFDITDAQEGDLFMRLGVRVSTNQEYAVRSVAGFLDDGTMLFAYSSADSDFLLTYLTPHISGLDIRFLLKLEALPTNALTVTVTDPGSMVFTSEFAKLARGSIGEMNRGLKRDARLDALEFSVRVIEKKLQQQQE